MENDKIDIFDKALNYLSYRMRTEYEMRQYLKKKKYEEQFIDECILRLKEDNYINDSEFAEEYVEYGSRSLKSRKQIIYELIKKGVDKNIIEQKLLNYDEEKIISQLIDKKYKNKSVDSNKFILYMQRKGFNYGVVKKLIDGSQ